MADKTKIEWADATVNAINGCSVISPGCKNCYAMKQAHRFDVRRGLTQKTNGGMVWTGDVRMNEKALLQPLSWKAPRRIFWNAHGDTFHENVPDEWIDMVFAVCALTPQHKHMILTKRPDRMQSFFTQDGLISRIDSFMDALIDERIDPLARRSDDLRAIAPILDESWPLPNVWLGTSVEDRARKFRIDELRHTPAAVRFLSLEPLLEDVGEIDLAGIHWAIVGGESGQKARPMHPDWVRGIRDQCKAAGVPFFFKQWGEWQDGSAHAKKQSVILSDGRLLSEWTVNALETADNEKPIMKHNPTVIARVGKKAAGNLLDGVQHMEFPG